MRKLFLIIGIAAAGLLTSCGEGVTYHTVVLANYHGADYVIVNTIGADRESEFTIYDDTLFDRREKIKMPSYRGQVIAAITGDLNDCPAESLAASDYLSAAPKLSAAPIALTLFFADGTVAAMSPGADELPPLVSAQTGMQFLTVAAITSSAPHSSAPRQVYALAITAADTLALYELIANEDGYTWMALDLALPLLRPTAVMGLSSCEGKLLLTWRPGSEQQVLSGWLGAKLVDEQWEYLPAPPSAAANLFAVCPYADGILLAQEDPAQKKITLAQYQPRAGQWTTLPLTAFAEEVFALPAAALEIIVGKKGLTLARSGLGGAYFMRAPMFPDDPGRVAITPFDETEKTSTLTTVLWWLTFALLAITLLVRRWARRQVAIRLAPNGNAVGADNPLLTSAVSSRPAGGAEDYETANAAEANADNLKVNAAALATEIMGAIKIGGIASVLDRALAMLVDGAICLLFPLTYMLITGEIFLLIKFFLWWLAAQVVYCSLAEIWWGSTPGKAIFKLRVRALNGGKAGAGPIIIRNVLRFVDFFPLNIGGFSLWYLIAAIAVYSTKNTQRVGDLLAGTVVRYYLRLRQRQIVLASGSPQRRLLIEKLGLNFITRPPSLAEVIPAQRTPSEAAVILATEKAAAVARVSEPTALVIGADTVVAVDNQVLGKPRDEADARRMLQLLSNRKHLVFTAVTILDNANGQQISDCAMTEVVWRELSAADIEDYLQLGEYVGRAGSYAIQGAGGKFVTAIYGSKSNVIGLPLELLQEMLQDVDAAN